MRLDRTAEEEEASQDSLHRCQIALTNPPFLSSNPLKEKMQAKESKALVSDGNQRRLLRNRVSAQQARERKKGYLNELEVKVKDMEAKNSELEEKLSTLQNENKMLRHILKNTTAGRRESVSGGEGSM
ncbi:hypothetical protein AAC387_Pa02g2360 [Persea americana]